MFSFRCFLGLSSISLGFGRPLGSGGFIRFGLLFLRLLFIGSGFLSGSALLSQTFFLGGGFCLRRLLFFLLALACGGGFIGVFDHNHGCRNHVFRFRILLCGRVCLLGNGTYRTFIVFQLYTFLAVCQIVNLIAAGFGCCFFNLRLRRRIGVFRAYQYHILFNDFLFFCFRRLILLCHGSSIRSFGFSRRLAIARINGFAENQAGNHYHSGCADQSAAVFALELLVFVQ